MNRVESWGAILLLGSLVAVVGCDRDDLPTEKAGAVERSSEPTLVPADTPGLLFVWIGDDGAFHTTAKPADIQGNARSFVRVLSEKHAPTANGDVFVTNLNEAKNGQLELRATPRDDWEKRGLEARRARVASVTPKDEPPPAAAELGEVDAIVYGADWCKPCHMAEDYLKKKGLRVVKKDIEEDPAAGAEMRKKLSAAGLHGASIPVLDVGGTMLQGFSPSAVDAALRRAVKKNDAPK